MKRCTSELCIVESVLSLATLAIIVPILILLIIREAPKDRKRIYVHYVTRRVMLLLCFCLAGWPLTTIFVDNFPMNIFRLFLVDSFTSILFLYLGFLVVTILKTLYAMSGQPEKYPHQLKYVYGGVGIANFILQIIANSLAASLYREWPRVMTQLGMGVLALCYALAIGYTTLRLRAISETLESVEKNANFKSIAKARRKSLTLFIISVIFAVGMVILSILNGYKKLSNTNSPIGLTATAAGVVATLYECALCFVLLWLFAYGKSTNDARNDKISAIQVDALRLRSLSHGSVAGSPTEMDISSRPGPDEGQKSPFTPTEEHRTLSDDGPKRLQLAPNQDFSPNSVAGVESALLEKDLDKFPEA